MWPGHGNKNEYKHTVDMGMNMVMDIDCEFKQISLGALYKSLQTEVRLGALRNEKADCRPDDSRYSASATMMHRLEAEESTSFCSLSVSCKYLCCMYIKWARVSRKKGLFL